MKKAGKRKIARVIRAIVPGLYEKGSVLAAIPRGDVLRGFCLESSYDPERVYISTFVQPLFIPVSGVVLSLGDRVGGGCYNWHIDEADDLAEAARQAAPFFQTVGTARALCEWHYLDDFRHGYGLHARAYSLILCGRVHEGAEALRGAIEETKNDDRQWARDDIARNEALAALAESDPLAAAARLRSWAAATAEALKVNDIP